MAILKFKKKVLVTVVESYDEKNDIVNDTDETFVKGEEIDVDIFDDRGDSLNVQFGDGSVIYGLPKNLVTIKQKD